MNASEKLKFIKLFANIAELYSKPLSQSMLEIYWSILKKYPLKTIQEAMQLHLLSHESGKFMPKPADLLQYLEPSAGESALDAWSSVLSAIKSVGAYNSLIFSDPLIHVVIDDMGGWFSLCQMQTFQLPHFAKEFQQRYLNYQRSNIQIPIKTITGIYSDEKPILIYSKPQFKLIQEKLS